MSNNDQAALATVSTKTDWVKPEIVSFVPAVDAQGPNNPGGADGGGVGVNLS